MPEPLTVLCRVVSSQTVSDGKVARLQAVSTAKGADPMSCDVVVHAPGNWERGEFEVGRLVSVALVPVEPRELTLTPDCVTAGSITKGISR